jgi:hypothetical protein
MLVSGRSLTLPERPATANTGSWPTSEFKPPATRTSKLTPFASSAIGGQVNLADIAVKVTEVLADLILMAPPSANLGGMVVEKSQEADPSQPRHSRH